MNVALRKPMSLQEFLIWEDKQELRFEFDGGQPVAMTGGTAVHAALQRNLAVSIGGRLRGATCQYYGSDLKIEVAGRIRYPDGHVVCTPVSPQTKVVRDPVVVFEVLSPSTARTDRIIKNGEYCGTPSIKRYVMLEQHCIAATVFARVGDDWLGQIVLDNAALEMPEIGITIPLAELYDGIDLTSADLAEHETG